MRSRLPALLLVLAAGLPARGQDAPVPPGQAAARMKVPEGFRVSLVAGEPQLVKPIAMTTDDRGRLWVVESHSYPHWITDGREGRDRVLIFEDRGDGRYEGKVFWDRGTNLSGIALGFGGVWLCAVPNLLFVPVRPGEDRPAGPPQVVLDGWDLRAKHNVFNGLAWGPDGWLYGCNGILSESRVGRPGTPDGRRVRLNCGVWRYHPTRQRFEVVASGTTNPWGLDFDDHGELFITNCVIKHLFHVVPGAHFVRMFGPDLNPYCYGLLPSCADHLHWAGGDWTSSRGGQGAHSDAGGGHAHAGAMVYLGDNWPREYRNRVFLCNLHGNRVNQDVLERHGSGYVARHGPDFLFANDPWFRGLALLYGPDGGVFVGDWHDTGECHNYDKTHPSGRVYKVTFGRQASANADLASAGDDELVRLQLLFIFYVLPVWAHIYLEPFWAGVLGLAVNYSAYEAENYRAGLLAVPHGQMEAALALGMSRWAALRRVIVPQAVRIVVPPVTNDFISLFKDTSVCTVIAVTELMSRYRELSVNNPSRVVELGLLTALLYLAMSYPLSLLARRLERRMSPAR